ncbi:TPA: helix-turn-helix domain-containing protein [Yersinia enterocolitica]|uniref:Cro/CI family transcriptional regulator n=1 Tax=Yersinia TaxID=629 RepID=UPI0005E205B4|nr:MULTISPECIES: Cro/CI family transcriptional regulator [Yersinia]EKN3395828.1 helix-turn-helix domain-containing protein [Yersinia enterocolitica]EKN3530777.1 helix-turn-helix domain-containing protein [Yersinia enterocolitica]EKN3634488.1 helix-turn-helix domain-containing protein [Yersinia enterocolitica]EKN3834336.1 helix-turn-helix domain-containing protein [Yersinia enterocolitica]EKN4744990.1 helix-turn-helix domain-containing protein [Yersinia enterocolitica]
MKKNDVITFFGTQRSTAEKLGISEQAVCQWGNIIPEKNALRLSQLTDGKLAYDESLYRSAPTPQD